MKFEQLKQLIFESNISNGLGFWIDEHGGILPVDEGSTHSEAIKNKFGSQLKNTSPYNFVFKKGWIRVSVTEKEFNVELYASSAQKALEKLKDIISHNKSKKYFIDFSKHLSDPIVNLFNSTYDDAVEFLEKNL